MFEQWTLLTSHGLVLLALARDPRLRVADMAQVVGISHRAAQTMVNDLVEAGYLERRRDGRRNRYLVRGDMALPHPSTNEYTVADLLFGLAGGPRSEPDPGEREAIVLACTDFRYQEPLRQLLASQGLLARAEVFLWPGGSSALSGRNGPEIVDEMQVVLEGHLPPRVVLVAHQDCRIRGAFVASNVDPAATGRVVVARRRKAVARIRKTFGVEPELWFLSERGAARVPTPHAAHAARPTRAAG